jgi:serine/threonine-protein kinase
MIYQVSLFTRRHRALVAGGALAVVALLLATAISLVAAVHAQEAAERETRQRLIAERTTMHLENMLMLPNPHHGGASVTVAEMLELMVAKLDAEEELPEVEAEVREAIGRTYLNLRQFREAVRQLERVAELRRGLDPSGERLGRALAALGSALLNARDDEASEAVFREAMEVLEPYGGFELEEARFGLVELLLRAQEYEEAKPIARDLLAIARQRADPMFTIARLRQLAEVNAGLGAYDETERQLLEARALAGEHLPDQHPAHIGILNALSMMRQTQGEREGALEASREAFELAQRFGRPGSFDWNVCLHVHVQALIALDRRAETVRVLSEARDTLAATHGPDHRLVRETSGWLARLQDRWRPAEPSEARDDDGVRSPS